MPGKPNNVEIRKWLPQFDILSKKFNYFILLLFSGIKQLYVQLKIQKKYVFIGTRGYLVDVYTTLYTKTKEKIKYNK